MRDKRGSLETVGIPLAIFHQRYISTISWFLLSCIKMNCTPFGEVAGDFLKIMRCERVVTNL